MVAVTLVGDASWASKIPASQPVWESDSCQYIRDTAHPGHRNTTWVTMSSRVAGAPRALMCRKSRAFSRNDEAGPTPHRDRLAAPIATNTTACRMSTVNSGIGHAPGAQQICACRGYAFGKGSFSWKHGNQCPKKLCSNQSVLISPIDRSVLMFAHIIYGQSQHA